MIKVQASVSKGWLNKVGGFEFNAKYYLDPGYRMDVDKQCHEFIAARFPSYPIYNMEDNLVQAEFVVPDMILVGAIQPNMIIAAALGAEFVFDTAKDSDVKGLPLKDVKSADELPVPESLLQLPFIKELEDQYLTAKQNYPDKRVIPSFFWDSSGRATIHGIVTTSMKFIGKEIFIKMMAEPDLVHAIHKWITDVYITVVRHFAKLGDMDITSIHVGECSGTLLDEHLFREFVTPYISLLGKEFGSVRLHSCGNADNVMPAICEVENLSIIDTGSNTSIAAIRRNKGKEFEINVAPPVEVLLSKDEVDMKNWLDKTIEENAGGNLKIVYHIEADYNEKSCIYISEFLSKTGLVPKGRLY
jgi:uroporphyrinogen-III decarboxylase